MKTGSFQQTDPTGCHPDPIWGGISFLISKVQKPIPKNQSRKLSGTNPNPESFRDQVLRRK